MNWAALVQLCPCGPITKTVCLKLLMSVSFLFVSISPSRLYLIHFCFTIAGVLQTLITAPLSFFSLSFSPSHCLSSAVSLCQACCLQIPYLLLIYSWITAEPASQRSALDCLQRRMGWRERKWLNEVQIEGGNLSRNKRWVNEIIYVVHKSKEELRWSWRQRRKMHQTVQCY